MRKLSGVLFLLLLGVAVSAAPEDQPQAWELKSGGRWQAVYGPTSKPIVDETLDRVEEMIQNGQAEAAHKIATAWVTTHQDAPNRDRGVYLVGQANFAAGHRINAYYNFDEILDMYPDSRYYYPSLERQYDIADQFLKGYKRKLLGLAIFGAETEATEMLYRIQQRSPGSPLAEQALLRVADYYYADAQFDVAADAYAAYVKNYPRSPYIPRVRLRQAFSALAQFRGIRFDATPVIDARQQLLDLAATYPKIAEEENIGAIIGRIDSALARKLLESADFYRRTHKKTAAVYHLKYLIFAFPNFPEAETAREKLKNYPADFVESVKLPGETPTGPSTKPTTRPSSAPATRTGRERP